MKQDLMLAVNSNIGRMGKVHHFWRVRTSAKLESASGVQGRRWSKWMGLFGSDGLSTCSVFVYTRILFAPKKGAHMEQDCFMFNLCKPKYKVRGLVTEMAAPRNVFTVSSLGVV